MASAAATRYPLGGGAAGVAALTCLATVVIAFFAGKAVGTRFSPEPRVLHGGAVATISDTTVWRWLSEDAIKPWQYRQWIFPRDPQFTRKAARVLDLYHNVWKGKILTKRDFVICTDEKTSIQARHRKHRTLDPVSELTRRYLGGIIKAGLFGFIFFCRSKRHFMTSYTSPHEEESDWLDRNLKRALRLRGNDFHRIMMGAMFHDKATGVAGKKYYLCETGNADECFFDQNGEAVSLEGVDKYLFGAFLHD